MTTYFGKTGGPENWEMRGANDARVRALETRVVGTEGLADGAVTSAKIQDGTVVDADISAALQAKINGALQVLGGVTKFQAGSLVATTDAGGSIIVTYPTAFATAPQCIVLTNGEDGQGVFFLSLSTRNATNFSFIVRNTSGVPIASALVRVNWMAAV